MLTRQDEQKVIARFSKVMQDKLDVRDYKGRMGWRKKRTDQLLYLLEDEVSELWDAIWHNKGEIKDEAVDVALYAMMIHDVAGRKKV